MLKGKKVLVLGLARSGQAAVELLDYLHADITINEYSPKEKVQRYDEYKQRGFEMICGGHPDELFERDFDFVIKNPGINYHKPFLLRLKERNIPVYTEIELGYQVAKPQNYIAVTGTNGKTTTVTLIYEILKKGLSHVHLAGNIGTPYCQIILENHLLEESNHHIVLEMSNFQLLNIDKFRPHISTVMNLTPDHLDYMASLDEYYSSKMNIYMNQSNNDYYIENKDDIVLQDYLKKYPRQSQTVSFSLENEADCHLKDQAIYYQNEKIIDIKDIKIVGKHNIQNIMIAICVSRLCHINCDVIRDVISSFMGVEHRIEFVRELDGVRYYNDSKATNTDAAIIALKAFEKPVILLMGGFEKGLDLTEMASYGDSISHLICFGKAGPRFAKDMNHSNTYVVEHLEDAIKKAKELAVNGDIVLLSPSTSSFDEFKSYEERGKVFKEIVFKL